MVGSVKKLEKITKLFEEKSLQKLIIVVPQRRYMFADKKMSMPMKDPFGN